MLRTVARATITLGDSQARVEKFGLCLAITMTDIWPFVVSTADLDKDAVARAQSPIPFTYNIRIIDLEENR